MIKTVKLEELASVKGGKRLPKGVNLITTPNSHPYIRVRDLNNRHTLELNADFEYVDDETQKSIARYIVDRGDIVLSIVGTIGLVAIVGDSLHHANLTENCVKLTQLNGVNRDYLYYFLKSELGQAEIAKGTVGAVQAKLPIKNIQAIEVVLPSLEQQEKIASILAAIDYKIEANEKINDNLLQQVMALFHKMFIETSNEDRRECRADEYFDISIGKTPPRKEPQWFSMHPADRVWVSISDMGSCGLYIADSSEYLTQESVDKFNVKVVPDNTVLLSFKLTVGRVAITDGAMTTNEAIAHFKTDKSKITEYLYCYLKGFNYQTMGSTSSIATAVNSKIIKAMPFIIPTDDELAEFHAFAAPAFAMIKANQRENARLAELRDSLLPQLMSGDIDVSNVSF